MGSIVSHTTTQTTLYLESLVNITSRPDYESLFYKVDIMSEIKTAVNGVSFIVIHIVFGFGVVLIS